MSEFINNPTYDEILNNLTILKLENLNLNNEIKKLKNNIQKLQDDQGLEICEYFNRCNSIKKTTDKYCFENVNDCYEALKEYFGCSDPLQSACDYRECYKEIFDREYDEDEDDEDYEDEKDEDYEDC